MVKPTKGEWQAFINDAGDQWTGWPISINIADTDKVIVRQGGFYPYEWDEGTSRLEACANAELIVLAGTQYTILEKQGFDGVEAISKVSELVAALVLTEKMITEALPKFNWALSALDGGAIQLLNEAPIAVRKALNNIVVEPKEKSDESS